MSLVSTRKTALFINAGQQTLPTAPAGFVETSEATLISPEFQSIDIDRISGKLNGKDTVIDLCRTKVSFSAPHTMRTSDKAGTALDTVPEYGTLLIAAGFDEVIDVSTPGEETVIYTNNNDKVNQSSASVYMDGNRYDMTGSIVSGTEMNFTVGEVATISNNIEGYLDDAVPTNEANPTITLSDEQVLVVSCADLVTDAGVVIPVKSAKIATNSEISEVYTMGGASGLKSTFVSDYALQLDLEFFVDDATFAREATAIKAGTVSELIIKIGLDDTSTEVNGKSVVITMPMSKVTTYTDSDDTDLLSRAVTYRCFDDGATPAMSIKHGFYA